MSTTSIIRQRRITCRLSRRCPWRTPHLPALTPLQASVAKATRLIPLFNEIHTCFVASMPNGTAKSLYPVNRKIHWVLLMHRLELDIYHYSVGPLQDNLLERKLPVVQMKPN